MQALSSSDLEIPKLSAEPKKAVKGKGRAPKAPAKGTGAKRAKTMKLSVKVNSVFGIKKWPPRNGTNLQLLGVTIVTPY